MSKRPRLTLHLSKEKDSNMFCPRCGVIVPRNTDCIPSPSRPQVHYHASCLLRMAQDLGREVVWARPGRAPAGSAARP